MGFKLATVALTVTAYGTAIREPPQFWLRKLPSYLQCYRFDDFNLNSERESQHGSPKTRKSRSRSPPARRKSRDSRSAGESRYYIYLCILYLLRCYSTVDELWQIFFDLLDITRLGKQDFSVESSNVVVV